MSSRTLFFAWPFAASAYMRNHGILVPLAHRASLAVRICGAGSSPKNARCSATASIWSRWQTATRSWQRTICRCVRYVRGLSVALPLTFASAAQISAEEKERLRSDLQAICVIVKTQFEAEDFYRLRFEQVPELVSSRRVLLQEGDALVASTDLVSILVNVFRSELSAALLALSRVLPELEEDERLLPTLMELSRQSTAPEYVSRTGTDAITADEVDGVRGFPLLQVVAGTLIWLLRRTARQALSALYAPSSRQSHGRQPPAPLWPHTIWPVPQGHGAQPARIAHLLAARLCGQDPGRQVPKELCLQHSLQLRSGR